jgi:predicted phage tail component-like protein
MFTITYNGISSLGFLKVTEVRRSVLPPSTNKVLEVDGRSGALFISKKHGMKKIEVDVAIVSESDTDLRADVRAIADWLDADKPEALVCSDEPDKTDYAILDGETNLKEVVKYGFGTLIFICPDPYSEGASQTKNLVAGTSTLTYDGTAPVYPTMTVSFDSDQPFFEITKETDKVKCTFNFTTSTTLVINFDTGKITVNGTLNQQTLSLDSEFFALTKGSNSLTVSTGAVVVVSYKDRFK